MTAVLAVETLLLLVLTVLVAGLLRSHASILRRLHELDGGDDTAPDAGTGGDAVNAAPGFRTVDGVPAPRGGPVPLDDPSVPARDVVGTALDGRGNAEESVVLRMSGVEHDSVLLFLSSGCATCQQFWADLAVPGAVRLPAETRLVVVTKDAAEESPALLSELRPAGVDVVMSSAAWEHFAVPGSPYVIAIDGPSGRRIGEGTGLGWSQVARLLAEATGDDAYLVRRRRRGSKPESDLAREARVDHELLAAGITPGDASLYGSPR